MLTDEAPNTEPPPVLPADGAAPNRKKRVILKMKLKRHASGKYDYYTTMEPSPEDEEKKSETDLRREVSDSHLKCFFSWLSEGAEGHRRVAELEDVFDGIPGSDEGSSEWEEGRDGEEDTAFEKMEQRGAMTCPQSTERGNEEMEVVTVKQEDKWDSELVEHNGKDAYLHFKPVITEHENSNLTGCRQSLPETLSLSEERLGKGSPLCEKLREQIVEQFKSNVPQRKIAKNLGISSSTVHNIIKRFRESGQISVRKGQGRKPILTGCDVRVLRQHCLENKLDSVVQITAWAQKHFGKTVSVNTVRRCIHQY